MQSMGGRRRQNNKSKWILSNQAIIPLLRGAWSMHLCRKFGVQCFFVAKQHRPGRDKDKWFVNSCWQYLITLSRSGRVRVFNTTNSSFQSVGVEETASRPLWRFSCFDYKKHLGHQWAGKPLASTKESKQRQQNRGQEGVRDKVKEDVRKETDREERERESGTERVSINEAWSCIYPN